MKIKSQEDLYIMKFCSNCNREYDNNLNFCSKCGGKLIVKPQIYYCPTCGKQLVENTGKFCPYCGHKIIQKDICKWLLEAVKTISIPKVSFSFNDMFHRSSEPPTGVSNKNIDKVVNGDETESNSSSINRNSFTIKEVLHRLFSFDGCIGRLEYILVTLGIYGLAAVIQMFYVMNIEELLLNKSIWLISEYDAIVIFALSVILTIIKFANITKRLHDIGKGGWWATIACLASEFFVFEIVLVLFLSSKKTASGYNEYVD